MQSESHAESGSVGCSTDDSRTAEHAQQSQRSAAHRGGDRLLLHVAEVGQQLAQERAADLGADADLAAGVDAVLVGDHAVRQLLRHLQPQHSTCRCRTRWGSRSPPAASPPAAAAQHVSMPYSLGITQSASCFATCSRSTARVDAVFVGDHAVRQLLRHLQRAAQHMHVRTGGTLTPIRSCTSSNFGTAPQKELRRSLHLCF